VDEGGEGGDKGEERGDFGGHCGGLWCGGRLFVVGSGGSVEGVEVAPGDS
jgi:hypothetical protein